MKRLHIVGRKNSGKTTLIVELVEYLVAAGLRVGTIKHTHHNHELDTPGKDSHRHRRAGAAVVGILSPQLNAVFYQPVHAHDSVERYEQLEPMFVDCDIILVEGHAQVAARKIEVWRSAGNQTPLADNDASILAIVSDDPVDADIPVLSRSDIPVLATDVRRMCDG